MANFVLSILLFCAAVAVMNFLAGGHPPGSLVPPHVEEMKNNPPPLVAN